MEIGRFKPQKEASNSEVIITQPERTEEFIELMQSVQPQLEEQSKRIPEVIIPDPNVTFILNRETPMQPDTQLILNRKLNSRNKPREPKPLPDSELLQAGLEKYLKEHASPELKRLAKWRDESSRANVIFR